MSPFTHGVTGSLIGLCSLWICPELAGAVGGKMNFTLLSALVGQVPDLDCALAVLGEKRGKSPIWQHRGIGHSLVVQIFYALLFPLILGYSGQLYLSGCIYIFVQCGAHLFEDTIDGSFGVYFLAPFNNEPISVFAVCKDIDAEFLAMVEQIKAKGFMTRDDRREIIRILGGEEARQVVRRMVIEAIFNVALCLLWLIAVLIIF